MRVIRCAKLDVSVDLPSMQTEVAALPDRWAPHFQRAHYDGGWSVLQLRALGGAVNEVLPFALDTRGAPAAYAATPLLAECPATARFLASLACPVMSARLLNLRRGAVIKPHRDAELAFEKGEARLHLPIVTNPGVEFVIDDERVVMEAGTCWYINANLTHRVANHGDTDRIHLVVDCGVNDWLREWFAAAELSHSDVRREAQEIRQMIELLHAMNTPASSAIIAQLEQELAGQPGHDAPLPTKLRAPDQARGSKRDDADD
jgi:quercetin dioxygenase-like cupin family protein